MTAATREEPVGRTLVIAPEPFYEDRGTPIAVANVLRALSDSGRPVDLLAYPIGEALELLGLRRLRPPNPLGFQQVPIGLSLRKLVLDVMLVGSLLRLLRRERYACIYAVEEAAFPALLLARRHGVPLIYDMQSCLPEQLARFRMLRLRPVQRLLQGLERALLRRVDVVACSAGLRDYVQRVAPETLVRAWRYPASYSKVSDEDVARLREKLEIPPGAPVVLYSGNLEPYQGMGLLVEAAARVRQRVPDVVFVLVGATPLSHAAHSDLARELIEAETLRLVARQPRMEIPLFLAMADVLVSPREAVANLPLKIFEYMAAGRPIVATDTPHHRCELAEDRAVLVKALPDEFAAAIVCLLQNPEHGQRLGAAARAYAQENLGWLAFARCVGGLLHDAEHGVASGAS
jgi:glycosyltransferase involved in cell wall biosynthesis